MSFFISLFCNFLCLFYKSFLCLFHVLFMSFFIIFFFHMSFVCMSEVLLSIFNPVKIDRSRIKYNYIQVFSNQVIKMKHLLIFAMTRRVSKSLKFAMLFFFSFFLFENYKRYVCIVAAI